MRFVFVPLSPRSLLPAAFLLTSGLMPAAHAQTTRLHDPTWGTWMVAAAVLPGGPRHWGGYAELQTRSNGLLRQYFYYETKGGITYDVVKNFTVMLAGGRYSTSDYRNLAAGPLSVEMRLWQQLTLTQMAARLKLEHRYRIEQRWTRFRDDEVLPPGSARYRGRMRYRFNAALPLNNATFTEHTAFVSAYNEVFFDPRGPYFERNRLYAGVGYQFDKHLTVQAGWLHQANYFPASLQAGVFLPRQIQDKNNLMLSMTYRIGRPRMEGPTEYEPSQPD